MEKLNNVVVENLNKEFGQELKKEFERLGVDTRSLGFINNVKRNDTYRFHGVINNHFDNHSIEEVANNNAKIITLEELKAIGKNDYPKVMWVGDTQEQVDVEEYKILIEGEGIYKGSPIYVQDNTSRLITWRYAKDIEEEIPEYTVEELFQKIGTEKLTELVGHEFKIKKA